MWTVTSTIRQPFSVWNRSILNYLITTLDGYQATDVYYRWNSRNSTGDVVYISEDLEMPQFKITNVELEEKTNIYNIGEFGKKIVQVK